MKNKTGKGNAYTSWSVILPEQQEREIGALLLGDVNSVNDRAIYKMHQVKTVVQCGKDLGEVGKELKLLSYPIVDESKYNIAQHFQQIYLAIRDAIKQGGVLVHCFSGISRSPAIVIAYLMRAYLIDYDTAMKRVRSKRFFVSPNDGFLKQLKNYQKHIKELRELRKKPKEEPETAEKIRYVSKSPARARGAAIPIMNTISKEIQKTQAVEQTANSPKTQKSKTGSSQSLSKYDPEVIKNIYGRTTNN